MVLYHAQRGTKQGRPGYLIWSILDGAAALKVPWGDILANGKNDPAKVEMVRVALVEFERKLAENRDGRGEPPPLPTPNARPIQLDNVAFYARLADRVKIYVEKMRSDRR